MPGFSLFKLNFTFSFGFWRKQCGHRVYTVLWHFLLTSNCRNVEQRLLLVCCRTERCGGTDHSRRQTHSVRCWTEQSSCATELLAILSLGISRHECPHRLLWFWQGTSAVSTCVVSVSVSVSRWLVMIRTCLYCRHHLHKTNVSSLCHNAVFAFQHLSLRRCRIHAAIIGLRQHDVTISSTNVKQS